MNETLNLPKWLSEILPEPADSIVLTLSEDGKLLMVYPDGTQEARKTLEEITELHDESGLDMRVESEVFSKYGYTSRFLSFPVEGGKFMRVITSVTDEKRIGWLSNSYRESLENIERFRGDATFFNAWKVVDSHPAYWLNRDIHKHPFTWQTYGHCSELRQHLTSKEEFGELNLICLETGAHITESYNEDLHYKERYGDWKLSIVAPTFEEALISLAHRTLLIFNDDGSDREEDSYKDQIEKPHWVDEIEETLKDIDI